MEALVGFLRERFSWFAVATCWLHTCSRVSPLMRTLILLGWAPPS